MDHVICPGPNEDKENTTLFTNHFIVREAYQDAQKSDSETPGTPLILEVEHETEYALFLQIKKLEFYGESTINPEDFINAIIIAEIPVYNNTPDQLSAQQGYPYIPRELRPTETTTKITIISEYGKILKTFEGTDPNN